jgi:hypothetical protein
VTTRMRCGIISKSNRLLANLLVMGRLQKSLVVRISYLRTIDGLHQRRCGRRIRRALPPMRATLTRRCSVRLLRQARSCLIPVIYWHVLLPSLLRKPKHGERKAAPISGEEAAA